MNRKMIKTNIEWLPEIPETWRCDRVKNLFYISKEQAHDKNPTVLSLARSGVKIRDISNNEGQLAESYFNYNVVKPGDLLLNPMDLYSGANCNMSEVSGVISPAYANLRAKTDLNPKYFDYYFKTQYWLMAMFAHGKGVSFDNRWTLNNDGLLSYVIPVPKIEEQNKIVKKITDQLQKIDELINIENKQILNFKSIKMALITETTSKGLNELIETKPVESFWFREIPKNWAITRLKYIFNFHKGTGISKEDVVLNGDTECMRYGEIYTKYNISFEKCLTRTNISKVANPQFFENGDVLFTCTGELVEEIGKPVTYLGNEKCLAGGDIVIGHHHQDSVFLSFALNSQISQSQRSYGKAKLKVVHISAEQIGNTLLVLPPLDEQRKLGKFLLKKCSIIDLIIQNKEHKISQLNQYKKSLIYEYVNGIKEVEAC